MILRGSFPEDGRCNEDFIRYEKSCKLISGESELVSNVIFSAFIYRIAS